MPPRSNSLYISQLSNNASPREAARTINKLKKSNSNQFDVDEEVDPFAQTVPMFVPELLSQMTLKSELNIRCAASQIATMVCSVPMIKSNLLDIKESENSPNRHLTPKSFRFAIKEEIEEDEHITPAKKLIDEMMVIGMTAEDVRRFVKQNEGLGGKMKADPQNLFYWSDEVFYETVPESHLSKQIKNFLFPFGFYLSILPTPGAEDGSNNSTTTEGSYFFQSPKRSRKSIQPPRDQIDKDHYIERLVNDCIVKDPIGQSNQRKFFLCFNSEETLSEDYKSVSLGDEGVLKLANPNMYYYYYGIFIEELVCVVVYCLIIGS